MKQYILLLLLCCFAVPATAQSGMYGAKAGIGYTTGYDSKVTPAIEAYYLHKISYHFYAGGSLFFQRYSLSIPQGTGSNISYGDIISIRQKSTYVSISPKIDYGLGYRNYIHVYASFGLGIYMGGRQWSDTHSPIWVTASGAPYGADTLAVNTTYNVKPVIARLGLGITERIPTGGYWNLTLSQEAGFMPGGLSKGPTAIQTPYVCLMVGVMHKYPKVFVEY